MTFSCRNFNKEDEQVDPEENACLIQGKSDADKYVGDEYIPWYPEVRRYSRRELFADHVVLLAGSCFSAVGAPMLMWKSIQAHDEPHKQAALLAYSVGLCTMLNASLAFNRGAWSRSWFNFLLFADKLGINLMVAGCYSPICLQSGCIHLLVIEWTLAVVGVMWQWCQYGVPMRQRPPVDYFLFLGMGWAIVPYWDQVTMHLSLKARHYIVTFGLTYTLGTIFNRWESLEFHKFFWHACVLGATALTYWVAFFEVAAGHKLGYVLH